MALVSPNKPLRIGGQEWAQPSPPSLPSPPLRPISPLPEHLKLPEFDIPLVKPGPPSVLQEYHGLEPPPGTHVPTVAELLAYSTVVNPVYEHYAMGLPYPQEKPVFWIKYGAYPTNSVSAQVMAYEGLRKMGSPVRAPGVFYACTLSNYDTYIVMEYIPGKTAAQLLENVQDPAEKEDIYRKVALALHELHRIPLLADSRPAAIDGGNIWHTFFSDQQAPRHYQNADQLEQHINLFLKVTKRIDKGKVQDLAREPMVFCQSDVYLGNFMVDEDGNVVAIDFSITSIVPSSVTKYAARRVKGSRECPACLEWVDMPSTGDIDNTRALFACSVPMVIGWSSFATCGRRIPGAEWEPRLSK